MYLDLEDFLMVFFIILYQMNCDSYVSTDTYPIDKLCFSRKCFFFFKIYLFIPERHRERGRDTGRRRSRLPAGSQTWDLIWGP